MKKYKNTFGPANLSNDELEFADIIHGLSSGLFEYDKLPAEVRADVDAWTKPRRGKVQVPIKPAK